MKEVGNQYYNSMLFNKAQIGQFTGWTSLFPSSVAYKYYWCEDLIASNFN